MPVFRTAACRPITGVPLSPRLQVHDRLRDPIERQGCALGCLAHVRLGGRFVEVETGLVVGQEERAQVAHQDALAGELLCRGASASRTLSNAGHIPSRDVQLDEERSHAGTVRPARSRSIEEIGDLYPRSSRLANSARDPTWSFSNACRRCVSTVLTPMPSAAAISLFERPSAASVATSRSAAVKPPSGPGLR